MATIKRYKLNKMKLLRLIVFLLFFIMLVISFNKIIKWAKDNYNSNKQLDKIHNKTKIEEVNDENAEIIDNNADKSDPYWDFIKMNLINVDFDELKKQNNNTIGWIKVNGTNINYPFVQASDNEYYLNHSFDKSYNGGGWLFLDYRNNKTNFDKNTIIYGHGRRNNTLFGTLRNILSSEWVNNTDNYVIKLSTEYENTLWQVFSIYRIPTTSDYLQISFTNSEFKKFTNMLIDRSSYDFKTSVNENDKILTLSTCYNDSDKVVLHAKLIKISKK